MTETIVARVSFLIVSFIVLVGIYIWCAIMKDKD